jgi:Bacterial pullanase-associated domain
MVEHFFASTFSSEFFADCGSVVKSLFKDSVIFLNIVDASAYVCRSRRMGTRAECISFITNVMKGITSVRTSNNLMRKIGASVVTSLMVFGAATGLTAPAQADNVSNTVTIHYQDPAATGFDSYKEWNLHSWLSGTTTDTVSPPLYFNGSDSFGKVYTKTFNDAAGITAMNIIVKKDGWGDRSSCSATVCSGDDKGNRAIPLDADGTTEVWIVKNAEAAYYTSKPSGTLNTVDKSGTVTGTVDVTTAPWAANAVDPNFDCANGVCTPVVTMPTTQTVTIHYQDPAATGFKSYLNWDTYMFNTGGNVESAWFNGSDSFGKVLTMNWTNTGALKSFGLIIRKHDWSNRSHCSSDNCTDGDHGNRNVALDADGTTEIWVVRDAAEAYYTSKPSGTLNKVKADGSADGTLTVGTSAWAADAVDPNYSCANGVCTPGALYPTTQTFKIHYNRPAGDYGDAVHGWNIWMWGTSTSNDNTTLNFNSADGFGKVLTVNLTNAGLISGAGFLFRSIDSWGPDTQQTGNYALSVTEVADGGTGTTEVWVIQGDQTVYTSNPFKTPTVTSLSASTGGPGLAVLISGTNFQYVNKVALALPAVAATKTKPAIAASTVNASFKVVSATKIVAALPAGVAAGAGKFVVSNPQFSADSAAFTSKTTAAKPVITTSTATGVVGGTVTVTGANVGAATAVKIGDLAVASITVAAADSISFVVPAGTSDGKISVTTAGGTATAAKAFALVPSIGSLSKSSVAIGGSVTVTGVNLAGVSSVKIGTKSMTGVTKGATTVTFTVPAGTASGKVTLVSAGGTVESADTLAIIPAPKVTGVTGTKTGTDFTKGGTLTIAGTDLTGATSVLIGASSITGYTVAPDGKSITFTAPAGKSGKVSVVTPGGTATSSKSYSTTN